MVLPIYFPPYEDELMDSWILRLAEHNEMEMREFYNLYLANRDTNHIPRLLNGLYWKLLPWEEHPDIREILLKHSIILGERFLYDECYTAKHVFGYFYNRGDPFYDSTIRLPKPYLRICPECQKEDVQQGKELYFRTWHAFENVRVCRKHGCPLIEVRKETDGTFSGKVLEPEENSKLVADIMYEIYARPEAMDDKFFQMLGKKPVTWKETKVPPGIRILEEHGVALLAECGTCHTQFWTTAHLLWVGRDCPVCEIQEDIPQKMISALPDYEFTKKFTSWDEPNCVRHRVCGEVLGSTAGAVLWAGRRCQCKRFVTGEKLIKKHKLYDFELLSFRKGKKRYIAELRHKKCGQEFETILNDKGRPIVCPFCDGSGFKLAMVKRQQDKALEFDNKMSALVGKEYRRIGSYHNHRTKTMIYHETCKASFEMTPKMFIEGWRCPECFPSELVLKENIEKIIAMFDGKYQIIKYPEVHDYRFFIEDTETGEVMKITSRMIIQDLICIGKPKYLRRRERKMSYDELLKYVETY